MRVGKPIEHLQTLLKTLNQRDEVLRVLLVGRSASLGIYLIYDMLQWVGGVFCWLTALTKCWCYYC